MQVFDAFQTRLIDSNRIFKSKQNAVDDTAREIKSMEKTNSDLSQKIAECGVTCRSLSETMQTLQAEKEKLLKCIDKQKSMIERFQTDIDALENTTR